MKYRPEAGASLYALAAVIVNAGVGATPWSGDASVGGADGPPAPLV